jgi:hypothetical protein
VEAENKGVLKEKHQRALMETPTRTKRRGVHREVRKALEKIRKTEMTATPSGDVYSERVPNDNPYEIVGLLNVPEYDMLRLDFSTKSVESKKVVLAEWASKNNINHVGLSERFKKLQIWLPHKGFPSDSRTLLCSPRQVLTSFISGGEFYHFGIRKHTFEFMLFR